MTTLRGDVRLADENALDLLQQIYSQIALEIVGLIPKILVGLIIAILTFLLIKSVNYFLRKMLRLARFDGMFEELSGCSLPFSIETLVVLLADLGIGLVSLYSLVGIFAGEMYLEIVKGALYYGARIASVVLLGIFLLTIFNTLVSRVRVETRLRSYGMFLVLLMVTAMLIDITALSDPVKNALITGLSIGVGISIGVFAVWFFFHDSIDRLVKQ